MSDQATHPREEDSRQGSAEATPALSLGHSTAEWVTLTISLLLILGLVGLVINLSLTGGAEPPHFTATPVLGEMRQVGRSSYLPIVVTNLGGIAAQEVRVVGDLVTRDGEAMVAEFTLDILAGGESRQGTLVFQADPRESELTVTVESFR